MKIRTFFLIILGLSGVTLANAQIPIVTDVSPDRGWAGGMSADGTYAAGTLVIIEGRNFNADPALNQVTFTGPSGTRINAPVIWASPTALHYEPDGILDDSYNYSGNTFYIKGFQRAECIAVRREPGYSTDRFYLTLPTFLTAAAPTGSIGTVKYPIGGLNFWTMLSSSNYSPYQFNRPKGIAVDDEGRVYLANSLLHRIETYTQNLGSNSSMPVWGSHGSGVNQFDAPDGVDVIRLDGVNYVFIADRENHRIVRTQSDGSDFHVMTVPASAGLIESVAAHSSGFIYATDRERGRLLRFNGRTGQFLSYFADTDLNHPVAVDVDADGYVYVIDGRWVKKFDADGTFLTKFGYTDSGDPFEELPPEALSYPQDLAVLPNGSVLVVDASLEEGQVSKWTPTDAHEIWVRVPENAITGNISIQTPSGSANTPIFLVLQPSPVTVNGWSVNQGIDEYPLVANKKLAVVAELTSPLMTPGAFEFNTFGSPVTDFAELVVLRDDNPVYQTSEFEITGLAADFVDVDFMLVFELPPYIIATPGSYTFALSLFREGGLSFAQSSTRQVSRRKSPSIGAVVLSHLLPDGSIALGDPLVETVFPTPSFDPDLVSWFDQTEMYRGFLNFNRTYPVQTSLSDVAYIGAMPTPGMSDGVTNQNAKDLLTWLEGIRITLNDEGADYDALVGLFKRSLISSTWAGKAPFDSPLRSALVSIGEDEIDPTLTRQDIGEVLSHEIGHLYGIVPGGPRNDPNDKHHSIFETVESAHTGWNTLTWSFVRVPESIMDDDGADMDATGFFEGPVNNRDGIADDGDYGHLFDRFANPHPKGIHYIEKRLTDKERPTGSSYNLSIVGQVFADKAEIMYVMKGNPSSPVTPNIESEYELVQYNSDNKEIFRSPIHLTTYLDGAKPDNLTGVSFRVTAPFLDESVRVTIEKQGIALGEISVPSTGPELLISLFNTYSDRIEIGWTGSHPENRHIYYRLLFSTDNGESFRTLAIIDGKKNKLSLPYSDLPGSNKARLKIIASDGFNQMERISPVFVVKNKPPNIYIINPLNGALLTQSKPIRALAFVYDIEDGVLDDLAIEWFLDEHIPIGSGKECMFDKILIPTGVGELPRPLPIGTHTLTVKAKDGNGVEAENTIAFKIGKDTDGDGISDESEKASGTDPENGLTVPGAVLYKDYYEWLLKPSKYTRVLKLVNPSSEPLSFSLFIRIKQGKSFQRPTGTYEISECSDARQGKLEDSRNITINLKANEECRIALKFTNINFPTQTIVSLGLAKYSSNDPLNISFFDEGSGKCRCGFLARLFGICRKKTRTLSPPARLVSVNPDISQPFFKKISDLGPLQRAGLPGASSQDIKVRTEKQLIMLRQSLESQNPGDIISALISASCLGPNASGLIPEITLVMFHELPTIRAGSAFALGQIGIVQSNTVENLTRLSKDENEFVAKTAKEALLKLMKIKKSNFEIQK